MSTPARHSPYARSDTHELLFVRAMDVAGGHPFVSYHRNFEYSYGGSLRYVAKAGDTPIYLYLPWCHR